MSKMDYDKSQPKHTPIIISIILSIGAVIAVIIGILLYFKASLKMQESKNESHKKSGYELSLIREWEDEFLNTKKINKITINDAIYITTLQYNN
jgi:hypothetical protein